MRKVPPGERVRLASQVDRIIARLRTGPATNLELAAISLKYTARISDARKVLEETRETIVCIDVDRETGRAVYRLEAVAPGAQLGLF